VNVNRSRLIDLAIVLAIALIGVVTWRLQPKADVSLPPSDCDLNRRSCSAELPGGGHLELSVDPRPIPTLRPLKLRLRLSGVEPTKAEMDFAGVAMNMGYNRPELKRVQPGRYEGETTLPACVSGSMEWQATVLIDAGGKVLSVPFRFGAGHGGSDASG
jgi:hypothetical protein